MTISEEESGSFLWSNKAGVTWTLTQDKANPTQFTVGKECPYFDWNNMNEANFQMTEVYLSDDGKVSGIRGPWGELYTKMES